LKLPLSIDLYSILGRGLLTADYLLTHDLGQLADADLRRLIAHLAAQNVKLKNAVKQSTELLQVTYM
jgi:hypothetical protein